ncbi:hypothetical protein AAF712_007904 [Marasmius tenuissimus]|uniref:Nephrocystin 3-like N-terminal domain-containing protein n=1 Tax=Marasmius tenuissimus TaxID=585030 RepID=A0ABR2ZUP1_9AGAR
MAQNVHCTGRDHNVNNGTGNLNVNNIGRDLVQNFTTTDSYPHLKALYVAVAGVGASHTSEHQFARGKCLEGTRVKALQNIREWRLSGDLSLPICWLSGSAGVGKSAIAMTVAKSCEKDGLVASFFFFRSDPKRNNPHALVPTIALGLIENIPSLRASINQKIGERPTILDINLEDQFQELVLDPYLQMKQSEVDSARKAPNLIVIDGLDECGDEDTQMRVLSTILSPYLEKSPWSGPPLKFFICSRPEAWIREVFGREDLGRLTKRIFLNLNDANRDIEQYFRHGFQIIRTTPKYCRLRFPSPWPSDWELKQLVRMASGQFAYAATAVKFVTLAYSNPMDQLRIILDYDPEDQASNSPFPELDRLYHVILHVNPNREKLLSVLAAILILPPYLPPSPEIVEIVLDLTPGEVDLTLRGMHSVLDIHDSWDEIRVFHTSFVECLFDRSRAGAFFIDRPAQTQTLARRWLQALSAERLRRYR